MKKYNVIYCDNPWTYDNKKTGRTDGDQPEVSGAATKYSLMTNEDIANMPIRDITICENDFDYYTDNQKRLSDHIQRYSPAHENPINPNNQFKFF